MSFDRLRTNGYGLYQGCGLSFDRLRTNGYVHGYGHVLGVAWVLKPLIISRAWGMAGATTSRHCRTPLGLPGRFRIRQPFLTPAQAAAQDGERGVLHGLHAHGLAKARRLQLDHAPRGLRRDVARA